MRGSFSPTASARRARSMALCRDFSGSSVQPSLTSIMWHIAAAAFIAKGRIAGDDEQPADAAERRDNLLDHAVGKIFLLRVAAHISERQDRDRRLVGER